MSAPLSAARALELVLAAVAPVGAEEVPIDECLGRVTATELRAAAPLPGFDNSAMDGYALRSADTEPRPVALRIVAESRAGHPAERGPGPGEAVRISTGAMLPPGADSVLPLEEAEDDGEAVLPAAPVPPGAHVRRAGEDLAAGELALPPGAAIGSAEIGVLASLGLPTVACSRRPTVAVLTSGDELLRPGEPAAPGQIYDSNRLTLLAAAREAGAEAEFAGALADDLARTRETIAPALDADFVVVSGGVSVGRHDHVKGALAELGVEQLFWRVAMRPGGPTWAGVRARADGGRTLVFGLPGNPVSAAVTFRLFAQPALLAAQGRDPRARRVLAKLADPYAKKPGKEHFLRCRLEPAEDGWRASLTRRNQGSHVMTSLLGADGLAAMPAEREQVEAGEQVEVLLL